MYLNREDFWVAALAIILVALVLMAAFIPVAAAEVVVLKNGSRIYGAIIEMNETDLKVNTADMGELTIKRYTVESIDDNVLPTAPSRPTPAPSAVINATAVPIETAAPGVNVSITNTNDFNDSQTQTDAAPAASTAMRKTASVSSDSNITGSLNLGVSNLDLQGSNIDSKENFPAAAWDFLAFRDRNLSVGLTGSYVDLSSDSRDGGLAFGGLKVAAVVPMSKSGRSFVQIGGLMGHSHLQLRNDLGNTGYYYDWGLYQPEATWDSIFDQNSPSYGYGETRQRVKMDGLSAGGSLGVVFLSDANLGFSLTYTILAGRLEGEQKTRGEYIMVNQTSISAKFTQQTLAAGLAYNFPI